MNGHDSVTRSGIDGFRPAGVGLAMTRSCSFCTARLMHGTGWRKYRNLWQCPACVSAREARAAERAAE